jgi:hypothetical protein
MQAFEEDELRLILFYSSPAGRKALETMPLLQEETLKIADNRFGRVLPRILELKSEMERELQALSRRITCGSDWRWAIGPD